MSTAELKQGYSPSDFLRDFVSGLVVFLVAVPLCLGIALASDAPPLSGLIAGIVGGTVVALFSGSHTSVSGPAAGLTAIVAAQIDLDDFAPDRDASGAERVGNGAWRAEQATRLV